MSRKSISEESLIKSAIGGSREAFDVLVMKYQYKIFTLASRYTSNFSDGLDITQDTFIKAYSSLKYFRGDSSFYTWLYKITVNTAKTNLIEKHKKDGDLGIDISDIEQYISKSNSIEHESPDVLTMFCELEERFLQVVDSLPADLKETLLLREIDELTYDEIAATMHCPIGTVRSRLSRARELLEKDLLALKNRKFLE